MSCSRISRLQPRHCAKQVGDYSCTAGPTAHHGPTIFHRRGTEVQVCTAGRASAPARAGRRGVAQVAREYSLRVVLVGLLLSITRRRGDETLDSVATFLVLTFVLDGLRAKRVGRDY